MIVMMLFSLVRLNVQHLQCSITIHNQVDDDTVPPLVHDKTMFTPLP